MRRAFAFAVVLALGVAAFAAAPSCVAETAPVIDTACPVTGTTPNISIASPADGACVEVGSGGDAFIPVVVAVENFKLDAPGACAECEECGHIALSVNGLPNNASANAVVDLVFGGNIASRYGELELTVTLVGEDGSPWTPPVDGGTASDAGQTTAKPISATVKITTAKSCSTSGSSSSSSSSGTGGSGGSSSSSSGTGGSGTGGAGGAMSSSSSSGTGGAGTGGAGTGGAGTGGAGTGGAGTGGK